MVKNILILGAIPLLVFVSFIYKNISIEQEIEKSFQSKSLKNMDIKLSSGDISCSGFLNPNCIVENLSIAYKKNTVLKSKEVFLKNLNGFKEIRDALGGVSSIGIYFSDIEFSKEFLNDDFLFTKEQNLALENSLFKYLKDSDLNFDIEVDASLGVANEALVSIDFQNRVLPILANLSIERTIYDKIVFKSLNLNLTDKLLSSLIYEVFYLSALDSEEKTLKINRRLGFDTNIKLSNEEFTKRFKVHFDRVLNRFSTETHFLEKDLLKVVSDLNSGKKEFSISIDNFSKSQIEPLYKEAFGIYLVSGARELDEYLKTKVEITIE